jgi:hypothetical protein
MKVAFTSIIVAVVLVLTVSLPALAQENATITIIMTCVCGVLGWCRPALEGHVKKGSMGDGGCQGVVVV